MSIRSLLLALRTGYSVRCAHVATLILDLHIAIICSSNFSEPFFIFPR